MLKGFREFIMRGNALELAIAVVIGTVFQKVIQAIITDFITPILNAFVGGQGASGLGVTIRTGRTDTYINFADIVNQIIIFVLTAFIVYLVIVVPMNKYNARREAKRNAELLAQGITPDPEPETEQELLVQIRDLLQAQNAAPAVTAAPAAPASPQYPAQ